MMVRFRRYWIQLTADRRKFGTLCTVLGVGLLLWARLIVISNMPKTAIADDQKTESASEQTPITERSADGRPASTKQVVLDERPIRDPFAVNSTYFPKPDSIPQIDAEPEKSIPEAVEDPERAEARRDAELRSIVREFSLDAAMSGASLAVINGTTYRKGEKIRSVSRPHIEFTLIEVNERAITLEYESRRFELTMSTPGS
jgi:hypothetical protein